ncbi:MAG TPA: hypothetical protein PKJ85_09880 [Nitrosomonas nitrosa]|uniref:hypothetical protein n=1 Tax=Nitrosomonas nitrosa TaxID=52442 RepID=UPI0011609EE2|nr:hypothetical protein [Nitrosomonas nitrosa]HNP52089.1 hypothetical protein [Nitrosomonas nitrosa]
MNGSRTFSSDAWMRKEKLPVVHRSARRSIFSHDYLLWTVVLDDVHGRCTEPYASTSSTATIP